MLRTWPSICNKSRIILYSYEGQCILASSHIIHIISPESPQEKSRLYDHQIYDESLAHML